MNNIERKKCTRCKVNLTLNKFNKKRDNTFMKMCIQCNFKARERYRKNLCPHSRAKHQCKDCGGVGICEHNKRRHHCKECGGAGICEHNKIRSICKKCKGGSICEHNKKRNLCKACGGGSICIHNKVKSRCKHCGGGSLCKHNKQKMQCKECDPISYLAQKVRNAINSNLDNGKNKHSIEYLDCDIIMYKKYIEDQFQPGMTWENQGEWHIDHIIPLRYNNPSIDEIIKRLHYTNTQPMWADENISKGNRFILGIIVNHNFHDEYESCEE